MGLIDVLHRRVWQALPREARRRALFALAAAAAPRRTLPAPPGTGPIGVAGALSTASGLGESARQCLAALREAGCDAYGIDLSAAFRQVRDMSAADWGTAPAAGGGVLITHVNAPYMPMALTAIGRRNVRGRRIVGYWAWELPVVPPDWRIGYRFVHEVWVPSRFCAEAVAAAGTVPVHVLPHPIQRQEPAPVDQRRWQRPEAAFVVATVFNMASGFSRKNPVGAIAAFRRAFANEPDARLVVKVINADAYPDGARALRDAADGAANIEIVDAVLSAAQLARLYADSDVLLSLHRSEGFGLTIAEAMAHGCVVVATDWSGNRDFMSAQTAVPIPCRMVPARDPQGTYDHPELCWADPDVDAAATALRMLRSTPEHRQALGRHAARYVAEELSAARYAERVRALLAAS